MKKLLVVLLVLGLAAPAMAQQWNFYGSVRTHLGYYDADENYLGGPAMDPNTTGGVRETLQRGDDSGTLLSLGGQSRFGARGAVSDKLFGLVEFGFRENVGTQQEQVYLRGLFGDYNFGAFKLRAGKWYTPGTFLGYSNMIGDLGDQGDANMLAAGLAFIGRQPLIQLTFGTFELAFIEPNTDANNPLTAVAAAGQVLDKDFDFPRIEVAYTFRTPVVAIRPIAGFQRYDAEVRGDLAPTASEDITSYMLGLGASFTLGPAYIKATVSYLQNAGNYGQSSVLAVNNLFNLPVTAGGRGSSILNAQVDAGGNIEDSELLQGTFVVGARINPMIGIEAGFGMAKAEVDIVVLGADVTAEQTIYVAYLQAPITVAKGMQIIPEIGLLDRGDLEIGGTDIDQGKLTYISINFRIDF